MLTRPTAGRIRVDLLWPSYIYVGHPSLPKAIVSSEAARDAHSRAGRFVDHPYLAEELRRASLIAAGGLSSVVGPASELQITQTRLVALQTGHYITHRANCARFIALCWLSVTGKPKDLGGRVVLLDPRAGAANNSIPGLPFGRPLSYMPTRGLLLVLPGWLGYSVTPLDPGSGQLLSEMDIT